MCGRCVVNIPADELRKIFDLIENPQIEPRYNIAPTQNVGVIRCCDEDNHNRYDRLKWGLIPSWSKDTKIASHTINAKSETVTEKPSFRHAIKYKRCIIPVSGFYEWSHTEEKKHPHFIHMADKSIMCLAGIWEHWKSPEGIDIETFSILTTTANKKISALHDRMPVILQPDTFSLWLNRNMHDVHNLENLYIPCSDDLIDYYKVPDLVNNPRFDSPSCIVQV